MNGLSLPGVALSPLLRDGQALHWRLMMAGGHWTLRKEDGLSNKVLEALLADLPPHDEATQDLVVGVYWTLVKGSRCGLATTLRNEDPTQVGTLGLLPGAGELHHRSLRELASLLQVDHPLTRSIGMAALQALLPPQPTTDQNAFDLLAQQGAHRRVALVGHFPFVPKLKPLVGELTVLEQRPREGDLPAEAAPEVLPQADVVCLSGTTLLNGTFEALMALCEKAYVILTGPTTPLSPTLFRFGVHALCGVEVVDGEALRPYILQGAAFKQMPRHLVKQVALVRG